VGRYRKGKTKLDFTEARDSEWQWHQLGHMQVCTLFQTDNYTSTSPLKFSKTIHYSDKRNMFLVATFVNKISSYSSNQGGS